MADSPNAFDGISLTEWASAYRPGMIEHAAERFLAYSSGDLVRIAFGNDGPAVDEKGTREPVFTVAVTLTPAIAVELARILLKHYAK